MKKILLVFILCLIAIGNSYAGGVDKYSKEYLQSKNHISIMKPLAEAIVKKEIKSALKKEMNTDFDVNFEGYTVSSMKKGIFKSLELSGENAKIQELSVPYISLKSVSDYNYIDYTKNPIKAMSDMEFAYDMLLSEETINAALKDVDYKKVISKVNKIAGSFFTIDGVQTKIINNQLYIITEYGLPLAKTAKKRSFVTSCDFKVVGGKIKAQNVYIDTAYGNLGLDKVANLINYLNPLEFTLKQLEDNNTKGNIENIKIVDNKVRVDGKIFIKGGNK